LLRRWISVGFQSDLVGFGRIWSDLVGFGRRGHSSRASFGALGCPLHSFIADPKANRQYHERKQIRPAFFPVSPARFCPTLFVVVSLALAEKGFELLLTGRW
jgi:hypothetical protein